MQNLKISEPKSYPTETKVPSTTHDKTVKLVTRVEYKGHKRIDTKQVHHIQKCINATVKYLQTRNEDKSKISIIGTESELQGVKYCPIILDER